MGLIRDFFKNVQKVQKVTKKDKKVSKSVKNDQKVPKMAKKRQKVIKMIKNEKTELFRGLLAWGRSPKWLLFEQF